MLDHGGLLLDNVHDGQYYLVGVLLGDLLAVLELLDHVLDEFQRHAALQVRSLVAVLEHHVLHVQALCRRRRILHLNGLEEGVALDDALAFRHAQLRVGIAGRLLDDELPVAQGLAVLQYGRVGGGAAVVGLDIVWVELDGLVGVGNRIAVRLELDVCLGAVGVERGLLVVALDSLRVEVEGGGIVLLLEGVVALVLELRGLVLRAHGQRQMREVCEARHGVCTVGSRDGRVQVEKRRCAPGSCYGRQMVKRSQLSSLLVHE